MSKKMLYSLVAVLIVAAFVLSACGTPATPAAPAPAAGGKVEVFSWWVGPGEADGLAAMGSIIKLTLSVLVDKAPVDLFLSASVCHNNRATYEAAYFIGLAFKGLTPHDKLVLNYLTQGSQH